MYLYIYNIYIHETNVIRISFRYYRCYFMLIHTMDSDTSQKLPYDSEQRRILIGSLAILSIIHRENIADIDQLQPLFEILCNSYDAYSFINTTIDKDINTSNNKTHNSVYTKQGVNLKNCINFNPVSVYVSSLSTINNLKTISKNNSSREYINDRDEIKKIINTDCTLAGMLSIIQLANSKEIISALNSSILLGIISIKYNIDFLDVANIDLITGSAFIWGVLGYIDKTNNGCFHK